MPSTNGMGECVRSVPKSGERHTSSGESGRHWIIVSLVEWAEAEGMTPWKTADCLVGWLTR